MKTKVKEFFRRNQTILFLLPATIVLMQLAWIMLNALDPRIGVEGFGDLFGYLLNGARAVLIVFSAWWIKRWCCSFIRTSTTGSAAGSAHNMISQTTEATPTEKGERPAEDS